MLTDIAWSISKNTTAEEPKEQKTEIRNIILINVSNLIQIQNLDLPDYLSMGYPSLLDFLLFILQYNKKITIKVQISVVSFFTD